MIFFGGVGIVTCKRVFPFMSVTARRSVDTYDDKVVNEYEED